MVSELNAESLISPICHKKESATDRSGLSLLEFFGGFGVCWAGLCGILFLFDVKSSVLNDVWSDFWFLLPTGCQRNDDRILFGLPMYNCMWLIRSEKSAAGPVK